MNITVAHFSKGSKFQLSQVFVFKADMFKVFRQHLDNINAKQRQSAMTNQITKAFISDILIYIILEDNNGF